MVRSPQAAQDYRLHGRLIEAFMADRIKIVVDFNRLNRTGSPVFNPWENVVPLLCLILASLAVMAFNLVAGTLVLIGAMFAYAFFVRPWIAQRLRTRTIENMLKNAHNWQVIWSIGGVVVTLTSNPRIGVVAPAGNWRAFAKQFEGGAAVGPGLGDRMGPGGAGPEPMDDATVV
ncbi:hypothetical protein F1188_16610 [Roseospira marina]|uniref:Uncharacterized protein n=1 Tax=Roseospira marina TaxID=140057 RepID=A0A5M6I7R2_9PROT|nr:hypothetical protein [Roseospira marina]KAA5604314.1 hypothetical protein F1188_16610 [Roseospira marina]MBB4315662.1 hypothetical protein [Roseospira marina]MBB5088720.1 hypothetical protein [Roseospira marina]